MVKHVVKGEKWACSTLEAGKNKPIDYIAKMRDFARKYMSQDLELALPLRRRIVERCARHSLASVLLALGGIAA